MVNLGPTFWIVINNHNLTRRTMFKIKMWFASILIEGIWVSTRREGLCRITIQKIQTVSLIPPLGSSILIPYNSRIRLVLVIWPWHGNCLITKLQALGVLVTSSWRSTSGDEGIIIISSFLIILYTQSTAINTDLLFNVGSIWTWCTVLRKGIGWAFSVLWVSPATWNVCGTTFAQHSHYTVTTIHTRDCNVSYTKSFCQLMRLQLLLQFSRLPQM